jgi:chemotaxis protein methyltransferase CheR
VNDPKRLSLTPESGFRLTSGEFGELVRLIEKHTGIVFTQEKRRDVAMKLADLTHVGGKASSGFELVHAAKSSDVALQRIINRLTIGESYFFRNRPHFDALKEQILPAIIEANSRTRRLNIWCAGCAGGEEPYSVAILLREAFPKLEHWNIHILATDINTDFIAKARQGVYSRWSFRGVEEELIERYFVEEEPSKFRLVRDIVRTVEFRWFNLSALPFTEFFGSEQFDLVLCRNVLIYFPYQLANAVVDGFAEIMVPGGYLLVGHSEAFPALAHLETVYTNATYYYRRSIPGEAGSKPASRENVMALPGIGVETVIPSAPASNAVPPADSPSAATPASRASSSGPPSTSVKGKRRVPSTATSQSTTQRRSAMDMDGILRSMRDLANSGKVNDAFERLTALTMATGKLDYRVHFLRAIVGDQAGKLGEAVRSLKQAVFLNKKFVLGHFYLGVVHERQGDLKSAGRYFRNVLHLLESLPLEQPLEEAEGLTVGRLFEIVEARVKEVALK